ncbi:MAG: alpha/beta hydrolase [Erysipelotrichaceae bacterium]|nr:alpha/beta hydrolase [Erysipelotrichaceae bacterium]
MSFVSWYIRRSFKKGDDKRDAGLTTPEDVKRYDDISYGNDHKFQVLDVYRPKASEGKLPVIVSVHGGGWVYGDKERYQYYCLDLAQRGFAVVNFTYGLAPQYKYPTQLKDTNEVFNWLMKNKEEYGFDTDNIFAVGDSAGGHLLALYCTFLNNEDVARQYSFKKPEGLKLKAVCLNCGVYEIKKGENKLTETLMKDLLGKPDEEKFYKISPMNYVNDKFPLCIVMTAEGDFLKVQALPMADRINESGGSARYMCYGDESEPLGHVFHLRIKESAAIACNDDQCAFFKEMMS